jgi:uncharacterized protein (TIGR02594 family)
MTQMQHVYDGAAKDVGTWEWRDGHNPVVVGYFADVGHSWVQDDETAWCAAFVGAMLKRAGLPHTGALNARSYLDWGVPVDNPQKGDVVIFSRGNPSGWQGHVAFFDSFAPDGDVLVLGGNQSNQVNVSKYDRGRVLGYRRTAKAERKSPAQSSTLQATASAAVAGSSGLLAAIGKLDPQTQIIVSVCGVVMVAALAWIARERLRKWAAGDK